MLASVTHLHINQPIVSGRDTFGDVDTTVLTAEHLPLAASFPRLVKLSVSGRVGPSFLQAFGSSCPQLSTLHASLSHMATNTLQQLPTYLPNLTCLGMLPAVTVSSVGRSQAVVEDEILELPNKISSIVLQACPKLTSFDTTCHELSHEMWNALPDGLVSCSITGLMQGSRNRADPRITIWQTHAGLRSLGISGCMTVQGLALLLSAAPNLSVLMLRSNPQYVSTSIDDNCTNHLSLVNTKLDGQVQVTMLEDGFTKLSQPSKIALRVHVFKDSSTSPFMSEDALALPAYETLQFCGWGGNKRLDLSQLANTFPNLLVIEFRNIQLDDQDPETLAACLELRTVDFAACGGVTCAWMKELCTACKSLRQLLCSKCKGVSEKDGRAMRRKGWAGEVEVSVRID